MANVPPGWSPAYYAFHAWLRKNRTSVKAGSNKTVIYSGMTNGDIPIYRQLPRFRSLITAYFRVDPAWESIEVVLKRIKVDWTKYQEGVTLNPKMVKNYRWMWDFAMEAPQRKFVNLHEGKQIWKNLSANYVRNATGKVYQWEGDKLADFPDFLLAEIPVLLKNKNVTPETINQATKLAPKSAAAWQKNRAESKSRSNLDPPTKSVAERR